MIVGFYLLTLSLCVLPQTHTLKSVHLSIKLTFQSGMPLVKCSNTNFICSRSPNIQRTRFALKLRTSGVVICADQHIEVLVRHTLALALFIPCGVVVSAILTDHYDSTYAPSVSFLTQPPSELTILMSIKVCPLSDSPC